MSVYNPTGSGNVHVDKVISGGRQRVAAKANPFAKKAAAKKVVAKKAPPFAKKMADAIDSPADAKKVPAKKVPAKKAAAKKMTPAQMRAMGEVGVSTPRGQKNAITAKTRAAKKLPSQGRITGGSSSTTGSRTN